MLSGIPGAAFLWLSVLLFAASKSIVRILSDLGAKNLVDRRNPISFCNLLFAGNMCAALALFAVYRKHWTVANLRGLSGGDLGFVCRGKHIVLRGVSLLQFEVAIEEEEKRWDFPALDRITPQLPHELDDRLDNVLRNRAYTNFLEADASKLRGVFVGRDVVHLRNLPEGPHQPRKQPPESTHFVLGLELREMRPPGRSTRNASRKKSSRVSK